MRVALCQTVCRPGDFEGNRVRAVEALRRALEGAPDLIVLPEAWATGFALERLDECLAAREPALAAVRDAVEGWGGTLIAGSLFVRRAEGVLNELVVLRRGEAVATYAKMHLFAGLGEHVAFERGAAPAMIETPLGPAGLALCYDVRFPELFRGHVRRGAVLFLVPSQWPQPRIEHWRLMCRARATENSAFLVGVNTAETPGANRLYGHSLAIDPWGDVLWEAGQDATVRCVDLAPERLAEVRARLPVLGDIREDLLRG